MTNRDERSVYVTNFSPEVTEDLIKELFIQVGPVDTVFVKKNEGGGRDFALVAFEHPESVLFAVETLDEIRLFNMPLNVKPKMGTEQEKMYRRNKEEQRSLGPDSNLSGMSVAPPPTPPNIPRIVTPNGNVIHASLMSIPYGPGGVHPSVMAGYNTPPGYNGPSPQNEWRGSMPSLLGPPSNSSSRNSYSGGNRRESYERRDNNYDRRSEGGRSYDRRETDRWNYGGSGGGRGGRRDYRDNRGGGDRYRNDSTPNRYGNDQGSSSYRRNY